MKVKVSFLISEILTIGLLFQIFDTSNANPVVKVRKCCPAHQVIDVNRMKCQDTGGMRWSPKYYPDTENDVAVSLGESDYEIITQIPKCPEGVGVHILPLKDITKHSIMAAKFRLLKSGRIVAKHANGNWIDIPSNSCIDGIMNYDEGSSGDSFVYTGEEINQAVITCPVV